MSSYCKDVGRVKYIQCLRSYSSTVRQCTNYHDPQVRFPRVTRLGTVSFYQVRLLQYRPSQLAKLHLTHVYTIGTRVDAQTRAVNEICKLQL